MKTIITALAMSAIFMACKKETKDLSAITAQVQASQEFKDYTQATNEIVSLVASGLNVDSLLMREQANAVWTIQRRFNLTGEETKQIFGKIKVEPVIIKIEQVETNGLVYHTEVNLANSCRATAYAQFFLTSVGCIATAAVPIMGEVLAPLCTNAAIAVLAAQLYDCSKQK